MAKILRSFDENGNPIKKCTGPCGRTLSATTEYFCKSEGGKYGLHSRCKLCKYSLQKNPPVKPTIPEGYKQCTSSCARILPATTEFFHRNEKGKYGLLAKCKQCCEEYDKKRRTEKSEIRREECEKHEEYLLSQLDPQISYQGGPIRQCTGQCGRVLPVTIEFFHKAGKKGLSAQCKECTSTKERAGYQEDDRAKKKVYREEHKEEISTKKKTYYQTPRGIASKKAGHQNRRARKKKAKGTLTLEQIEQKLKAQRYRCYYAACGHAKFEKKDGKYIFHIEHTIPVSRTEHNPRNDINYVVLACPSCNMSKHNKLPHEWVEGGRLL